MARQAGSVLHALFIGVIVKWFMDPKQALSAREVKPPVFFLSFFLAKPPAAAIDSAPVRQIACLPGRVPPPGGMTGDV